MLRAELALARGENAEAARLADERLNRLERYQTRIRLPLARYLQAKVVEADNRLDDARALLVQAGAEAKAMGIRWRLPELQIALFRFVVSLSNGLWTRRMSVT